MQQRISHAPHSAFVKGDKQGVRLMYYPLRETKPYAQRWACFEPLLDDYCKGKEYKTVDIMKLHGLPYQKANDVRRAVLHAYRVRLYAVGRRPCRYCTRLIPKSDGDVCEDCREEKRWRILLKPPPDNPLKDNPYFVSVARRCK